MERSLRSTPNGVASPIPYGCHYCGAATDSIDILVYAGLHLPEANPSWPEEIRKKCEESVRVRIAFGDPECPNVRARGDEEGVGAGLRLE
jgi:hypothetical protein